MRNKSVTMWRVIVALALAVASFAIAQEPPATSPTPTPSAPPPDREFRSSEEVSADTEVDFPADL